MHRIHNHNVMQFVVHAAHIYNMYNISSSSSIMRTPDAATVYRSYRNSEYIRCVYLDEYTQVRYTLRHTQTGDSCRSLQLELD